MDRVHVLFRDRGLATVLRLVVLGVLSVFALLASLCMGIERPDRQIVDRHALHAMESRLWTHAPDASRVWSERYQTGSCCSSLYAFALVAPGQAPVDVQVFRLEHDQVHFRWGTYEERYDPSCQTCFPPSVAEALLARPDHEVWGLLEEGAYVGW
jgi:hypothetical protein